MVLLPPSSRRTARAVPAALLAGLAPFALVACGGDDPDANTEDTTAVSDTTGDATEAEPSADGFDTGPTSDLDQALSDLQTVLQISLPTATSFEIDGVSLIIGFSEGTAGGQAGDCLQVSGAAGGLGLTDYPIVLEYPDGTTDECGV